MLTTQRKITVQLEARHANQSGWQLSIKTKECSNIIAMNTAPRTKSIVPAVVKQDGVTLSEQRLGTLCDLTFLSLWSFPTIYRDQRTGPGTDGKEVCDLLVVFGNDVIIFSDKNCAFPDDADLDKSWSRWFRRGVLQSAKQLWGAERWICEFPDRLFLDRRCNTRLPLAMPPSDGLTIHRVVIAHDSVRRCRDLLGGSGSLMLCSLLRGTMHYELSAAPSTSETDRFRFAFHSASGVTTKLLPFTIGDVDPEKGFVHVFDDVALSVVMGACDTVSDFVGYLTKREQIFRTQSIWAAGEEDLLAIYLQSLNSDGESNFRVADSADQLIVIPEGEWMTLVNSDEWRRHISTNHDSYGWDRLIERFSGQILGGTAAAYPEHSFECQELAIRALARENRNSRRALALALRDFLLRPYRNKLAARVIAPPAKKSPYYVFLTLEQDVGMEYEAYRKLRRAMMFAYSSVLKLTYPDALEVVIIGTEPKRSSESSSQDVLYADLTTLTDEDLEAAKVVQAETGFLTKLRAPMGETGMDLSDFVKCHKKRTKKQTSQRNRPCPCGSGRKYKKCCMSA